MGQAVSVRVPAYPDRAFPGVVVGVEAAAGRKNMRTKRPREKVDTKVVEVVVQLGERIDVPLPFGLEVTARFE